MNTSNDYSLDEALDEAEARVSTVSEIRDADLARQITSARANPRGLRRFRDKLTELCTLSEEVAASCTYSLPRGGKRIVGPSVRFAELVVASYGNLHVGVTVLDDKDDDAVVVTGHVMDLETNTRIEVPVRRRVTKRRGKKKDEDAKNLAVAAGGAIAYRNAVFKAVPRALWEDVWHKSQEAATGKGTMKQRREAAISLYAKFGASEEQVLEALDRSGPEEITEDDLRHLRGMVTAIRTGEISVDDALRPPEPERQSGPGGSTSESPVAERIAGRRQAPAPAPSEPAAEVEHDPETGEVHELPEEFA